MFIIIKIDGVKNGLNSQEIDKEITKMKGGDFRNTIEHHFFKKLMNYCISQTNRL